MLYIQRIDDLSCGQVFLAGEDGAEGNQVGIIAPDSSVAIIAVAIVLLPHNKMSPMDKRE